MQVRPQMSTKYIFIKFFSKIVSTLKFIGSKCLSQTKATSAKNSRQVSLWRQDVSQPDQGHNEQKQQQSANHGSDNADANIAHCLTPFSHSGLHIVVTIIEHATKSPPNLPYVISDDHETW